MREYRVKVTVRNNLLLSAIEAAGFKTQSAFAEYADMDVTAVNDLVALRKAPINDDGSFSLAAQRIMESLGASPSDLWTNEQLYMSLKRNTAETPMDAFGIRLLAEQHQDAMTLPSPEDARFASETSELINTLLDTLTPREAEILRMRNFDELTMQECAEKIGVTPERIRQIEAKALRKMRHPARVCHLNAAEIYGTIESINEWTEPISLNARKL